MSRDAIVRFAAYPEAVQAYCRGATVTVMKDKPRSAVYRVDRADDSFYVKVTAAGEMENEARMTGHLSKLGACPNVRMYRTDAFRDYLITDRIVGADAASSEYIAEPSRLCDVFADSLSYFHRLPGTDCPCTNGLEDMVSRAEENYRNGKAEMSLLRHAGYASVDAAYKDMTGLYRGLSGCEERTIIHGDYCLPNLMLHQFERRGYIDVGYGGLGDPHYDLFWALWSLQFNLGSDRYAERFIEAYGRVQVDEERLRLCGLVSVFNGFRGQDYYERQNHNPNGGGERIGERRDEVF